ncbi:hypothetical protein [Bacillus salipaludis]|uniref:Glycosyltransferase family 2 protein n=1 Tax=Bacillus salipaludis TaxID=2547811 RepID=A0ABW8RL33_9BACI
MKQIVNVVINYANEDEVLVYAEHLSKQTIASNITLVIVVNKEGAIGIDGFKNKLDEIALDILVFDPNENLGYMNGLIYGYRQYYKEVQDLPTWVVMSNTDIAYSSYSFFEDFLGTDYTEDTWCIGPSVYSPAKNSYDNPKSTERYSIKELNRRIFIFEHPSVSYFYKRLADLKAKLVKNKRRDSQFVYSVHGCFFIVRNEFSEVLKSRKYKSLMYSEEAYIAEITRAYGKRCYYDSTIEIIHNENTVTSKLGIRKISKYLADSLKVIRDEFFIENIKR